MEPNVSQQAYTSMMKFTIDGRPYLKVRHKYIAVVNQRLIQYYRIFMICLQHSLFKYHWIHIDTCSETITIHFHLKMQFKHWAICASLILYVHLIPMIHPANNALQQLRPSTWHVKWPNHFVSNFKIVDSWKTQ